MSWGSNNVALWTGATAFCSSLAATGAVKALNAEGEIIAQLTGAIIVALVVAGTAYSRERLRHAQEDRVRGVRPHRESVRMTEIGNVEIYEDDAGEWRWRLQAANGEVVAVGEGYSRKADAVRGWQTAQQAFAEVGQPGGESNGEAE